MQTDPEHTSVVSGEVRLAVQQSGDPAQPTVVLVHGFPDTHTVWDPVVDRLRSRWHVVTYDVRGAGGSSAPGDRAGYRMDRLVDDLVAVLDATSPDRPVHLVGHDWGSVQSWGAVLRAHADPRLVGRIATFTTISGPALEHAAAFLAAAVVQRRWLALLRQLGRSWYVGAFQVPFAPEWAFHHLGARMTKRLARTERLDGAGHWGPTFERDAAHGVNLYRANVLGAGRRPAAGTRTRVPVQLLVPVNDAFLTPDVYEALPAYVEDLTRVDVDAGHWVIRTHPDLVADHVTSFASART